MSSSSRITFGDEDSPRFVFNKPFGCLKNFLLLIAYVWLLAFGLSSHLHSYAFRNSPPAVWPDGTIPMDLEGLSGSVVLMDGNRSWKSVAENALATWNLYMDRAKFTVYTVSPKAPADGDGFNQVFFNSTVYGQSFGAGVLAVALSRWIGTTRIEGDVVFNSTLPWDSYRGNLLPTASGDTLNDFQRVALHEFGHTLGLAHPDQAGQSVLALMNSTVSDLDHLTTDDAAGAFVLYAGLARPTIVLTSPTNYAIFSPPATINLVADASANGHSITKVQFYSGANLLGEATTAPYAFTWSGVAAGAYTNLTARLVYDGGSTLDSRPPVFVLVAALRPRNTAPTISAIPDQTTSESTPTVPIPFTIGDAETNAAALLLSAASDNSSLVPTRNITFGGSDTNRTITLTPITGASGTVTITITVTDGSLTNSTTFQLTVRPTLIPFRSVDANPPPPQGPSTPTPGTTYNGLFYEADAVRLSSAGSFTISVRQSGKYSGSLQFGTQRYPFSGQLDAQGNATNTVSRRGGVPLTLGFRISGSQADQISGQLTDGTWRAGLVGDLAGFGGAYAGNYTLIVPGYDGNSSLPAGDSFGSLKVDTRGRLKFVGTLADGTKVTQSASLSQDGYWPLYFPLYSGGGSLMSWVTFTSKTNSDLSGKLIWMKQAAGNSKYYLGGFTSVFEALGSTYRPTGAILGSPTATLTFCGGGLASDITNSITIGPGSKAGTADKKIKLSFSASTGTFKGTFLDPASGKPLPFSGAVFQKLNTAYGVLFGTGDQTSEVSLAP